jgi:hypothetical protein
MIATAYFPVFSLILKHRAINLSLLMKADFQYFLTPVLEVMHILLQNSATIPSWKKPLHTVSGVQKYRLPGRRGDKFYGSSI